LKSSETALKVPKVNRLWRFLLEDKGLAERILTLKLALDNKELLKKQELLKRQVRNLIDRQPCFFDSC